MSTACLFDELETLAEELPALRPWVERLRDAAPGFAVRAPLIAAAASCACLGPWRSVTLLLKLLAEEPPPAAAKAARPAGWPQQLAQVQQALGDTGADLEAIVIEQRALGCDRLEAAENRRLAVRHAYEQGLLEAAPAAQVALFRAGKCAWLLDEIKYADLLGLRHQLVEDLLTALVRYLGIIGRPAVARVEAAHQLALARYRHALDDPTLTPQELEQRLQRDLQQQDPAAALVGLEPELRLVLLNSVDATKTDFSLMEQVQALHEQGRLQPADEAELREAVDEFRRLARLIHPDALARHPRIGEIAPRNQERLKEIWVAASATHDLRVQLTRDRLLDYLKNLKAWRREAERILREISFPMPSLLLHGDTLEERQADLDRVTEDVRRHLCAVRDEICALEFDDRYVEHMRVIMMSPAEQEREQERIQDQAEAWQAEARRLAAQLEARKRPPGGEAVS